MTTDLLKPELSFLNNMDLPHKNAWAPFSNYTLQLHMDFHGFKWLISFCACSFQISIIMFIFLYRLTGGDHHADQRGKACLKCFCDTFDSDRFMNSLTRRWMSICSRSMIWPSSDSLIHVRIKESKQKEHDKRDKRNTNECLSTRPFVLKRGRPR